MAQHRIFIVLFFTILFSSAVPNALIAQSDPDLEYRKVRVTFVPGLSTNGIEAPQYSAKYSLNILAGYHGGLDGYELGIVNINRYYSRGVQIGVLNATGGDLAGIQMAGLSNFSGDDQEGIQFSGLGNISGGTMQGIQFSGLSNIAAESLQGLQFTGGINLSDEMQGLQLAGIGNIAGGSMEGLQFAGIVNLAGGSSQGLLVSGGANISGGEMQGLIFSGAANISGGETQGLILSGGVNITSEMQGIIGSGILNTASRMQGIQFTGGANIFNTAQGVQIGLVNVGREFRGVPVGLISFYGNGRKNVDFWFSDGGFAHLGLNLGTHEIYNKIFAGYNTLIAERDVWTLGWSIGSYRTLDEAWNRPQLDDYYSTHDFTIKNIFDSEWSRTPNWIYSYSYLLGRNFNNGLSVYAGPSANLQISSQEGNSDYTWYSLIERSRAERDIRFWIGINAGIRLFGQ
ncbi:hypothetical protein DYD21_04285 [Rhodohalobacter sp. SW132]|uniref:hypothetical protein n=1 Tax=Rhodohalobacter sp. SW132 TaxID=2293433 RepID=UPI000E22ACDE|nr:hypothetical protein [Rhodohalobacter sp. SW132]REL39180.1 hypothetical protein DYD21_04285 [Rhodohalobacter sp. SW132]